MSIIVRKIVALMAIILISVVHLTYINENSYDLVMRKWFIRRTKLGNETLNIKFESEYLVKEKSEFLFKNVNFENLGNKRTPNISENHKDPSSWYIIINESGYYELTDDLWNLSCDCGIFINASNVTLDGKGHIIDGSGFNRYGIYIYNAVNVTIKNITIQEWIFGIYLAFSNKITIIYNTLQNNDYGIYSFASYYGVIKNNAIQNNNHGIYLEGRTYVWKEDNAYEVYLDSEDNNTIMYNFIVNNGHGLVLYSSSNNIIMHNIFVENGLFVSYSYRNIVENNTVNGKMLVYLENQRDLIINTSVGQVILINCENITIENQNISNVTVGVELWETNRTMIVNSTISDNKCGVYLWNSYNNMILNTTIEYNEYGILLYHGYNTIIQNNTVSNNDIGILCFFSSSNVIMNNTIQNQNEDGITIQLFSVNNTIAFNVIRNNRQYGILLMSDHNTIVNNTFINDGLVLLFSYNNTVENNTVNEKPLIYLENKENVMINVSAGQIILVNCRKVIIKGQNISNTDAAIELLNTNEAKIANNTIRGNYYGVYLSYSYHSIIANNTIQNNDYGIDLDSCANITIVSNIIGNNDYGVLLEYCNNLTISNNVLIKDGLIVLESYNNTIMNNTVNGKPLVYLENQSNLVINTNTGQIILVDCKNITIKGQNITETEVAIELLWTEKTRIMNSVIMSNKYGIYLQESSENVIINSTIINNEYGIFLKDSRKNVISYDMIRGNEYGILSRHSMDNIIANNTIDNNYYGIYLYSSANTIMINIIKKNDWGVYLEESYDNFYLNNFLNNIHQYYISENFNGQFYSNEPLKYEYLGRTYVNYLGNFWSDYKGIDSNEDGIGDTPYGLDTYPLMEFVHVIDGKIIIAWLLIEVTEPKNETIINTITITVKWRLIFNISNIDHYEVFVNESPINTSIPPNIFSYTLTLEEELNKITIKAIDNLGHIGICNVWILVDTTPPAISIISPPNGSEISSTKVTIKWVANDDVGINHYEIYVDGSLINASLLPHIMNYTLELTDGKYNITVLAVDVAGNIGWDSIIVIIKTKIEWYIIAFVIGLIISAVLIIILIKRRQS